MDKPQPPTQDDPLSDAAAVLAHRERLYALLHESAQRLREAQATVDSARQLLHQLWRPRPHPARDARELRTPEGT